MNSSSKPEPFEIELASDSYSLRVRGLQPVSQVAQYAADAIGIIGEPLGMLKDSLQTYRIQRSESAAAALLRAREIKQVRGEEIKPVSAKVLAPWLEGASAEDLRDENILELWARVLANSESAFSPDPLLAMDILRRIGPQEARLLDNLINPNVTHGTFQKSGRPYGKVLYERTSEFNVAYCKYMGRRLFRDRGRAEFLVFNCAFDLINSRLHGHISSIHYRPNHGGGFGNQKLAAAADILDHLGITESERLEFMTAHGILSLSLHHTTRIGLRLFEFLCLEKLSGTRPMRAHWAAIQP